MAKKQTTEPKRKPYADDRIVSTPLFSRLIHEQTQRRRALSKEMVITHLGNYLEKNPTVFDEAIPLDLHPLK